MMARSEASLAAALNMMGSIRIFIVPLTRLSCHFRRRT